MNNNERLKLIRHALELTRDDIAEAVTAGGIATSKSRADAWIRSSNAKKKASGGSAPGGIQRRAREMSDQEFDAFCLGLKSVIDKLENQP